MKITLYMGRDGLIYARYSGPGSERVAELFGARDIPTPYGVGQFPKALQEIQTRNPDSQVRVSLGGWRPAF